MCRVSLQHIVAVLILVSCSLAPSVANADFLQQLFGIVSPPITGDVPLTVNRRHTVPRRPHSARRRIAEHQPSRLANNSDGRPQLQQPVAILRDRTLHQGDALMAKDGIRIYSGPASATHDASEFLPLAQAHVTSAQRKQLMELDASKRSLPTRPGIVASKTSILVRAAQTAGKIRFVGP